MKDLKEFEYKNHKCLIVKNENEYSEWLCAYVFLPEYTEFYKNHVKENPDYFDRCETEFNSWFYENVPNCTWLDFTRSLNENNNILSCGLDLHHFFNIETNTTLDVEMSENQLKEMVDYIIENKKIIENFLKKDLTSASF